MSSEGELWLFEKGPSKDFAEVLLNLAKGTVDLAVKKLYNEIKDKIKFDVYLDIEVPDDTT